MTAIIKYNAGNIRSVQNALNRLNEKSIITDDFETIRKADRVIFPGVGEAASAMRYLKKRKLDILLKTLKQPVLGICLGLQLMCRHSEEGDTECLNIFETHVKKFPPKDKVPHIGWNNFNRADGKLFENIKPENDVYFVHAYFAEITEDTDAVCKYITPFAAALSKDNFFAVQFHPEKSAEIGEIILKNFLKF